MDTKTRFEEWARSKGYNLHKGKEGVYYLLSTQELWEAWREAWQQGHTQKGKVKAIT